jgi:hypothetical protein
MDDVSTLRLVAEKIPVAQSPYIHQDILHRMASRRQCILSCYDADLISDYIDRASDEECLAVLSEIANHAPLTDDYQGVFCHLVRTVFTAAGVDFPTPVRLTAGDRGELTTQLEVCLENLRKNIRKAQRGIMGRASFQ